MFKCNRLIKLLCLLLGSKILHGLLIFDKFEHHHQPPASDVFDCWVTEQGFLVRKQKLTLGAAILEQLFIADDVDELTSGRAGERVAAIGEAMHKMGLARFKRLINLR